MGQGISRREFLTTGAATTAALGLAGAATSASQATPAFIAANPGPGNWVRWLDDRAAAIPQGVTWGTPWPRGKLKSARHFALRNSSGQLLPLQSWPLAYWPDGSMKWSAHALPPAETGDGPFELVVQRRAPAFTRSISARETASGVDIDTGAIV